MPNNNASTDYNMFSDLKTAKDMTKYTLFRGTTDFSQLAQFDMYEKGYPYLIVVSIPDFLEKMAANDNSTTGSIKNLINSYKHILEFEFKGLESGIENITSSTGEINNGYQSLNVINKTELSSTNFSMTYTEKAGSVLTKMHELYLRSIKDPGTGFKTYNGLIEPNGIITPETSGYDKECFSFLYMHTDNTGLLLERAIYYVGCQPTTANLDIYQGTKGDIQFAEVSTEFTGFPIMGAEVNKRAKEILDWMNNTANKYYVHRNSWNYGYEMVTSSEENRHISSSTNSGGNSLAERYGLEQASLTGNN